MRRVTERHVQIAGHWVFVRESGEGQPVLLINGLGAHTAMWAPLESTLDGLRLIEFDAPGTGRSSVPGVPVTVPALAWVATQVLDRVGVQRAHVLGYSMGGVVVQQLAACHPDRVGRLVLVATGCGWGSVPGPLPQMLNLATPLRYWSTSWHKATMGGLVGGRARYDPDWIASLRGRRQGRPPTALGYVGQLASVAAFSSLPLLGRIEQPTLIVTGDDDPLVPAANALVLASRLPEARVFVAEDEGHLLLMDEESTAHPVIRDFLVSERHTDSQAWSRATAITAAEADAAVAGTRRQAQPLGALGAIARSIYAARQARLNS